MAAFYLEVTRPVLRVLRRSARRPHVDLQTMRETLVYIESDCRECPGLEGVAAALGQTIIEIDRASDRLEGEPAPATIAASFVPARL